MKNKPMLVGFGKIVKYLGKQMMKKAASALWFTNTPIVNCKSYKTGEI